MGEMFYHKMLITLVISVLLSSTAMGKLFGQTFDLDSNHIDSNIDDVINAISNHEDGITDFNDFNKVEENLEKTKVSLSESQTFDEVVKDMERTLSENEEPCSLFDPPAPNFKREGRRISETKCLKYVWEAKRKEETDRRVKKCMARFSDFTTVIGGRIAEPSEFPHMGALGWPAKKGEWKFLCGSFLVSDKFVLTAAHCQEPGEEVTDIIDRRPKIVRFGVDNIIKDETRNPVDIKILKFIKHPSYRPFPHKNYDIAVVELAKRVTFDKFIQPACIISQNVETALVTGWGVVDKAMNSQNTSDKLKVVDVDIIPTKDCGFKLRRRFKKGYWNKVKSHQICATKLEGEGDTCNGDSGGPLQAKLPVGTKKSFYNVIGVTSFGFTCGVKTFPTVYTKVYSFIDWIESIVWSSETRELRSLYNEDSGERKTVHKVQHYDGGDLYWFHKLGGKWSYVKH